MRNQYGQLIDKTGKKIILVSLYQGEKLTKKLGKWIPYCTLNRHWECDVRKSISKGDCIARRRLGKFGPKSIELETLAVISGIPLATLKKEIEKEMVGTL
jgi:hypothetical protein